MEWSEVSGVVCWNQNRDVYVGEILLKNGGAEWKTAGQETSSHLITRDFFVFFYFPEALSRNMGREGGGGGRRRSGRDRGMAVARVAIMLPLSPDNIKCPPSFPTRAAFFVILHNLFLAIVPAIEFLLRLVEGEEGSVAAATRGPRDSTSLKKIPTAEFCSLLVPGNPRIYCAMLSRISLRAARCSFFQPFLFQKRTYLRQIAFIHVYSSTLYKLQTREISNNFDFTN